MKKLLLSQLLLISLATITLRADTALSIAYISSVPCCGGPCWDDEIVVPVLPHVSGTFTLNGVAGTGTVQSAVITAVDNIHGSSHLLYSYSLDLSGLAAAQNHCLKLLIHFGSPVSCAGEVLVLTNYPGAKVSSATKAAYGDITFLFGSSCVSPNQPIDPFEMLTDVPYKTNSVSVIDDYVDPANGTTNHVVIKVAALVPDIPPNWAFASLPIPNVFFQGSLSTNVVGTNQFSTNHLPISGQYDFTLQLVDALSNGLPVSPPSTTTVAVVNGLFNTPLPFDPSAYTGPTRWLNIGVRPSGLPAVQFTPLASPLLVAPAPTAFYAYTAGVVGDISPDQAVLSLNGINGNLDLAGGQGIAITLNGDGKTITISQGVTSDRNLKTDFAPVNPQETLDKLLAMPIQTWRFTNETAAIRHLGPTAQDFMSTFGLGTDNRLIGTVDEGGVALSAIQGLNQKLETQLKEKDARINALEKELSEIKQSIQKISDPER